MNKYKIVLSSAILSVALSYAGTVSALTFGQACVKGNLCFKDDATNNYGKVYGNNTSWYFGRNNDWNKKADWYRNMHTSMSACLYRIGYYGLDGRTILLPGTWLREGMKNYASANNFVSNKSVKACTYMR